MTLSFQTSSPNPAMACLSLAKVPQPPPATNHIAVKNLSTFSLGVGFSRWHWGARQHDRGTGTRVKRLPLMCVSLEVMVMVVAVSKRWWRDDYSSSSSSISSSSNSSSSSSSSSGSGSSSDSIRRRVDSHWVTFLAFVSASPPRSAESQNLVSKSQNKNQRQWEVMPGVYFLHLSYEQRVPVFLNTCSLHPNHSSNLSPSPPPLAGYLHCAKWSVALASLGFLTCRFISACAASELLLWVVSQPFLWAAYCPKSDYVTQDSAML